MVTLQHCLKVACCLLAHHVIADDNHISLLLYLFLHKLFEGKNLVTNIIIVIEKLLLCSKSHKGQLDEHTILTWCYPSLVEKMELKHLKSSNPEPVQ